MSVPNEVDRIKQVYAGYSSAGLGRKLWSAENPGNQTIVRERMDRLGRLLQVGGLLPLTGRRILDIGCGNGDVLASFAQWGARPQNLFGVDLLAERAFGACARHPDLAFQQSNAEHLAFAARSFDMIVFFTVFSSILDQTMRQHVAQEADRILAPGGTVVWYDFRYRNPNNPHTQPLTPADVSQLFPGYTMRMEAVTLLPPLARRLGAVTDLLYPALAAIPPLRSHYVGLLFKS